MAPLAVRAAAATVMPITVAALVPALIRQRNGDDLASRPVALVAGVTIGAAVLLLGDSVAIRFAREGRGTLAPLDPPKRVVRSGAYRFTRNPMYIAVVVIIAGQGALFRSWPTAAWAAFMAGDFHLYVTAVEEPSLRSRLGSSYDSYAATTPRWLPRRQSRHVTA